MPADFINKLSRMFQDIKVSEDLNNQFKEQQKDRETKTGDSVNERRNDNTIYIALLEYSIFSPSC